MHIFFTPADRVAGSDPGVKASRLQITLSGVGFWCIKSSIASMVV